MEFRINIKSLPSRTFALLASLVILASLATLAFKEFVAGALTENRSANANLLAAAAEFLPNSPRLLSKLAESEISGGAASNLANAEMHARRAVELSPDNYNYRLLLAQILEARGDTAGAEAAFYKAIESAPNYGEVHWKTANFLVRAGKIAASIEHFRFAANLNPRLAASALDLVWATSKNDADVLGKIAEGNPKAELKLALFLAQKSRFGEAVQVFQRVDKNAAFSAWETVSFLNLLIKNDYAAQAEQCWRQTIAAREPSANQGIVWNGDFEIEKFSGPGQFDWQIAPANDFARIGIAASKGKSGARALQIDFLGRDTTVLDNEVRHSTVLRAGAAYRLEFYVKTEDFRSPEGPKVVVSDRDGKSFAASEPIAGGTSDWSRRSFDFTAVRTGKTDFALYTISIKRKPRYAYDEPTRGRVLFDDFAVTEIKNQSKENK